MKSQNLFFYLQNEKYYCDMCKKYIMVMWEHEHSLIFTTSGAGTAYPSKAPEFTPGFKWFVLLDL
jgi:hypothetical protein